MPTEDANESNVAHPDPFKKHTYAGRGWYGPFLIRYRARFTSAFDAVVQQECFTTIGMTGRSFPVPLDLLVQ